MIRSEIEKQIQDDYIEFIKKESTKNGLSVETVADITRSIWLYFLPDGSIETDHA